MALERAVAALAPRVDVESEVHVDDPAEVLLRISEHVDLLVCGSRGYGPLRSVLLGGVSRRLRRRGRVPGAGVAAQGRPPAGGPGRSRRRGRGAMTAVGEPAGGRRRAARRLDRPRAAGRRRRLRASCARCSAGCRTSRAGCASSPPASTSTAMARWAASRGSGRGYGVVATVGAAGADRRPRRLRARARPTRAEIAFEVADDWHGLRHRHDAARPPGRASRRAEGIDAFTATVHPSNHRMAQVLRDSGFPVEVTARARRAASSSCPASLDADGDRRLRGSRPDRRGRGGRARAATRVASR